MYLQVLFYSSRGVPTVTEFLSYFTVGPQAAEYQTFPRRAASRNSFNGPKPAFSYHIMSTSQYLQDLNRDGFVVIKSIVSKDKLDALREVSSKATQLAREGQWPYGITPNYYSK